MQADDASDAAVNDGAATLNQQPGHEDGVTRSVCAFVLDLHASSLNLGASKQARVLLPTDDGTHQLKTVAHKPAAVYDGQDTDEEQDEKEEEEEGDAEDADYLADFPDETDVCGAHCTSSSLC